VKLRASPQQSFGASTPLYNEYRLSSTRRFFALLVNRHRAGQLTDHRYRRKSSYAGTLMENFVAGDLIDFKGLASAGLALAYTTASGELQITRSWAALAALAFQNSILGTGAPSIRHPTERGAR
jgi:hypothetical protein